MPVNDLIVYACLGGCAACVCVVGRGLRCKGCKVVGNEVIFIRTPCPLALSRPQIQFVCGDRKRVIECV